MAPSYCSSVDYTLAFTTNRPAQTNDTKKTFIADRLCVSFNAGEREREEVNLTWFFSNKRIRSVQRVPLSVFPIVLTMNLI